MIIVEVTWGEVTGFIRDPELRGDFVCGVVCNEYGVGLRDEGCMEGAEMRIYRPAITRYQEFVY